MVGHLIRWLFYSDTSSAAPEPTSEDPPAETTSTEAEATSQTADDTPSKGPFLRCLIISFLKAAVCRSYTDSVRFSQLNPQLLPPNPKLPLTQQRPKLKPQMSLHKNPKLLQRLAL